MDDQQFHEFYEKLRQSVPCRGSTLFLLEADVRRIWDAGRQSSLMPAVYDDDIDRFTGEGGRDGTR